MGFAHSGRRPQSTALKMLRGNPSKTRLNTREPQLAVPDADADTPPADLNPIAAAEYARLMPLLRGARMISKADVPLVLALVHQWATYIEAQHDLDRRGLMVKTRQGNPYFGIRERALKACLILWRELGLTPSSRSRIAALPAADDGPAKWAGLL